MKWKDHIAIANAISDVLGFEGVLTRALSQGSVEPDKHPDEVLKVGRRGGLYTAPAAHHDPSLGVIMKHVWDARLAYLDRDNILTMRSLGMALHYIQDKSVSKGFLGLWHESRENKILSQVIPENAIKRGIKVAVSSPHYVKDVIKDVKPKNDPSEIMDQACMCSATIVEAIIKDRMPPNELVDDLRSAKVKYRKRTIPLAIMISGIVIAVFVIIGHAIFGLFGCLVGYIVQRLDFRYHYLKEEAKWFGIS